MPIIFRLYVEMEHVSYFGVSGSFGLCNMYNDSSVKFHENRVTFSLGYNF